MSLQRLFAEFSPLQLSDPTSFCVFSTRLEALELLWLTDSPLPACHHLELPAMRQWRPAFGYTPGCRMRTFHPTVSLTARQRQLNSAGACERGCFWGGWGSSFR